MTDCPRYESCGAPICPLDPDWRLRTHIDGEAVCAWLLEGSKAGSEARIGRFLHEDALQVITSARPAILARWGRINHACSRAATTGSRIAGAARLRGPHKGASAEVTARPATYPKASHITQAVTAHEEAI